MSEEHLFKGCDMIVESKSKGTSRINGCIATRCSADFSSVVFLYTNECAFPGVSKVALPLVPESLAEIVLTEVGRIEGIINMLWIWDRVLLVIEEFYSSEKSQKHLNTIQPCLMP